MNGCRWYGVFRDVSKSKQTEICLHDFLSTTSHDARTPLSSVLVAAQLLRERCLGDEARELLTAISASARVLLALTQNVLLTKRLEAGSCEVPMAPVDIRALVADVVSTSRIGLAQQSGTSIQWDDAASLPASVLTCADHVSQALLNLVIYCVHAAEGAPVRIVARSEGERKRTAEADAQRLVLEVAAAGCARSIDDLSAMLNPYSCVADDPDEQAEGLAPGRFGLHVSRRLTQVLGGELRVRSNADEGVVLTAVIPVLSGGGGGGGDAAAPPSPAQVARRSPAVEPPAAGGDEARGEGAHSQMLPMPTTTLSLRHSRSVSELKEQGLLSSTLDLVRVCVHKVAACICVCVCLTRAAALVQLLINAGDAFFVSDGTVYTYVSPGALEMLQYEQPSDLVGCACTAPTCNRRHVLTPQAVLFTQRRTDKMDAVHPDDRASAVAEWESVKAQGGRAVPHTFTCRFRRKDGSYIWIETASCITPTKWYGVRRCVRTAMHAA